VRRPLRAAALASLVMAAPAASQPLPPCPAAPCASDAGRRVVVLSYYRDRDLTNLINAELGSGIPDDTPVFYGIYWGTLPNPIKLPPPPPPPPGPRPVLPSARFAPIFSFARTEFFNGREIEAPSDGFAGRIPSWQHLMRLGPDTRYRWGLELGRRYRDRIRLKRAKGVSVTTWQFDELRNEVAGRGGYRLRQLTAGVLRGLAYGRASMGDVKLPGIVYATVPALDLAARGRGASIAHFWQIVDDTSLYFVGEEYPEFTGPPSRAARRYRTLRAAMARRDAARRSLAAKYVVGLTPGARLLPGLGGNVRHRSRAAVQSWRRAYVRARAASRPIGIGEYNFTFENATVPVMRDALSAVAAGLRLASKR
jgi:hypothetical protein